MRKQRIELGRLSDVPVGRYGALAIRAFAGRRGPFSVQLVSMDPGARTPALHHARTHEFFLVLKGRMRAELGGKVRLLAKGDFAFIPPGVVHEFHVGRSPLEVLVVFSPAFELSHPDIVLRKT